MSPRLLYMHTQKTHTKNKIRIASVNSRKEPVASILSRFHRLKARLCSWHSSKTSPDPWFRAEQGRQLPPHSADATQMRFPLQQYLPTRTQSKDTKICIYFIFYTHTHTHTHTHTRNAHVFNSLTKLLECPNQFGAQRHSKRHRRAQWSTHIRLSRGSNRLPSCNSLGSTQDQKISFLKTKKIKSV